MTLELGFRLILICPTLLFFLGCCFRSIIENHNMIKIIQINSKIGEQLGSAFLFLLSIDSIFLFIANSLVIMYQFHLPEIGTIILILGVISSVCILIAVQSKNENVGAIGILFTFGALGGIFSYFMVVDSHIINNSYMLLFVVIIIGIILGAFLGIKIINIAIQNIKQYKHHQDDTHQF